MASSRRAGQRVPFVLTWFPSHEPTRRRSTPKWRSTRRRRTGSTGPPAAPYGRLPRRDRSSRSLVAQGADLRADRRDRRRADHVAAGADRRRAQLGLPLLLVARRDAHADGAAATPVSRTRRGRGASGCCARSPAIPPQVQIMYGIARRAPARRARARVVAGLRGLAPGADRQRRFEQLQLDVYGEVLDAAVPDVPHGVGGSMTAGRCSASCSSWLEDGWREPDAGIWEVRGAAAALHPLEGDGLGRLRPRHPKPRGVRPRRARSSVAASCGTRSTRGAASGFERAQAGLRPVRTAPTSSMPAS